MLRIFRINGSSMLPTLSDGDYVVAITWWGNLKNGDLVVASHPEYPRLIKRIAMVDSDRSFTLVGDNSESLSSQQMGVFTRSRLLGKVIYCINAKRSF